MSLSDKKLPVSVGFVLSDGEELGLRGIRPACFEMEPDEAIVVGDTVFDVQMGKNAGTRTCGVTYGNGSRESMKDADWIIEGFGQLLDILLT